MPLEDSVRAVLRDDRVGESREVAKSDDAAAVEFIDLMNLISSIDVDFTELEKLDDSVIDGVYSFAYNFYEKGKYSEAENLFRLLTAMRLYNPLYWKGLGATLQMQKKYGEAVEAYSRSALVDEKGADPYPHFHAAECLLSRGEIDRGVKALLSAKTIAKEQGCYYALTRQIDLLLSTWRKERARQNGGRRDRSR